MPDLIDPVLKGRVGAVFVSRMRGDRPIEDGRTERKYLASALRMVVDSPAFSLCPKG